MKMKTIPNLPAKVTAALTMASALLEASSIRFRAHGDATSNWPDLQISIQPRGFWGNDTIRLRYDVMRESEPSLSWSSGGRDTNELASDLDAAQSMAGALVLASHIGTAWKNLFAVQEPVAKPFKVQPHHTWSNRWEVIDTRDSTLHGGMFFNETVARSYAEQLNESLRARR